MLLKCAKQGKLYTDKQNAHTRKPTPVNKSKYIKNIWGVYKISDKNKGIMYAITNPDDFLWHCCIRPYVTHSKPFLLHETWYLWRQLEERIVEQLCTVTRY